MSIERGGMGVSMKPARVEVPRVTIPAPERGIKAFTPKESIAKDSQVTGFNLDTFKPFMPVGFPQGEPSEKTKVNLTKEKIPSAIFDGQVGGMGIEVKPTNPLISEPTLVKPDIASEKIDTQIKVTIPAPINGIKPFAAKEELTKEGIVEGFNFDTFKPFTPAGVSSLETSPKVSLTKKDVPSVANPKVNLEKAITKNTEISQNEQIKVSLIKAAVSDPQVKVSLEKKNKVSLVKPENVSKQEVEKAAEIVATDTPSMVSLIKQSDETEQKKSKVDLIKTREELQDQSSTVTIESVHEEPLNPILPKPAVQEIDLKKENAYKVSLEKSDRQVNEPTPQTQSFVSLRKTEPLSAEEPAVIPQQAKVSLEKKQVAQIVQDKNEEIMKPDEVTVSLSDNDVVTAVIENNKESEQVVITEKTIQPTEQKQELPVAEINSEPKTDQIVSLEKTPQEIKIIQRESDLQQAQTVIQAWDRLAGPQEQSLIREKVMAIIDQKQEMPEVTSPQSLEKSSIVKRPFIPELEQEEFETIVREMVKEGFGLQTIYEELTERKVLVNQQPPSLTIIFQIVLTEITVQQENKEAPSVQREKKTLADLFETPQNKKRLQREILKEETLRPVEEERPEHDLICFIGDLEEIVTKELHQEEIKDEFALGNYITFQSADKGDAQGIVNKKADPSDTKLIESDGKIALEEICPACLGLLKERDLKMTVTRNSERLPLRKTSNEVIVFNYSKSSMDLAA